MDVCVWLVWALTNLSICVRRLNMHARACFVDERSAAALVCDVGWWRKVYTVL